ncbi:hypothetical protein Ancab_010759 [Ancistrocladus abbreviatus]
MGGIDMAEESVKQISLKDLSRKLAEFAKARDWEKYHSPWNLLLAMVGEVGELSEIFQWRGEVDRGLPNWAESEKEHLGEELSNVMLYLLQLADICGIDLGDGGTMPTTKTDENSEEEEGADNEEDVIDSLPTTEIDENSEEEEENEEYDEDGSGSLMGGPICTNLDNYDVGGVDCVKFKKAIVGKVHEASIQIGEALLLGLDRQDFNLRTVTPTRFNRQDCTQSDCLLVPSQGQARDGRAATIADIQWESASSPHAVAVLTY